jgi:hypothetical protein
MEIIVISGLALLGYELSKDNKIPRKKQNIKPQLTTKCQTNSNKYPFVDDKITKNSFLEHNQPFFTERKVSSNDVQKQRRMESFTGTDTEMFWKKKKEVENLFSPHKDLSNINGSQPTSSVYGSDRYSASLTQKMDGVAPTEKIQVGRGLNKGSDSAASGGFHDSTRILPENVNGYKKNSFSGRTLTGKAINNMRNTTPHIENNEKPERYYTDKDRQIAPTKSQVNKEQQRGEIIMNCTNRDNCNEMVHLGAVTPEIIAHTQRTHGTRTYDSSKCNVSGNPHAQVLGNNPQHGQYVMPIGDRENCGTVTNAHFSGHGGSNQYSDAANPTLREDKNNYEGQAYNSQVNTGGHLSNKFTANPTMREDINNYQGQAYNSQVNTGGHISNKFTANPTMREDINNYQGQAYHSQNNATGNNSIYTVNSTIREETAYNSHENAPTYNNGQSSRNYQSNPTQRQSTHSSYTGVANSKNKGNQNQYSMRTAQPYRKREDVQQEFIPNGGRMNVREDAIAVNGAVHLPTDCNSHPVNHGIHNQVSSINQVGNIEFANKGSHNPRNDFNLAKNILKNNEYSHSVV